jgi:hypothetical protein
MSTEQSASGQKVMALQSSSPFCINSDESKQAEIDAIFDLRVTEPYPNNLNSMLVPVMPQPFYQTH